VVLPLTPRSRDLATRESATNSSAAVREMAARNAQSKALAGTTTSTVSAIRDDAGGPIS